MKVLMADDHWVFRAGLKHLLKRLDKGVVIFEAGSIKEAKALASDNDDFDLVLLDLMMPGSEPFTGLSELHELFPKAPIVVLSVIEARSDVIRAIELGAMGYVSKAANGEEIIKALRHVLSGDVYIPRSLLDTEKQPCHCPQTLTPQSDAKGLIGTLTQRQREVFGLLAQGKSNPEIARDLGVSSHTVRIHISAILRALGVSNRTQAAVLAANYVADNRSESALSGT